MVLFLVLGIVGTLIIQTSNYVCIGLVSILFFMSFLILNRQCHNLKIRKTVSLNGVILICLLGALITSLRLDKIEQQEQYSFNKKDRYIAEILDPLQEKNKSYQTVIRLNAKFNESDTTYLKGEKILTYLSKKSEISKLHPGAIFIFSSKINSLFDNRGFKMYNYSKGIHHQTYISKIDYINNNVKSKFRTSNLSDKINFILKKSLPDKNAYNILQAFIIGNKKGLNQNLKSNFSNAGISHILAVSGLHVGIIYMLINFLCNCFFKNVRFNLLKILIALIGIWAFALMTGLAASVFRAAVMFSLFAIGKGTNKNCNSYNIVAASALFILIGNPLIIYDVGFQLSYAAVLGILTFHSKINNLFFFSNSIFAKMWSLSSVSISATLGTLPFTILYFQKIPVLFIVTNLYAVPMATILLILGISLITISSIPTAAIIIGKLIQCLTNLLITITTFISNLPFSSIQEIEILPPVAALISLSIVLLGCLIHFNTWQNLRLFLTSLILLFGLNLHYSIDLKSNSILTKENKMQYNDKNELERKTLKTETYTFSLHSSQYPNK